MSDLDVIPLPGQPGKYGRRILVEAWMEAGSPPVNDAGRLYAAQKQAWDAYQDGTGSPADNPDDESQRLAHVRFAALDIDPTPDRVRRLSAAGLYRPYSYEQWHWELPNVRQYALVRSIPIITPPETLEEDMYIANVKGGTFYLVIGTKAHKLGRASGARESGIPVINYVDDWAVAQLKTVVSGI